MQAFNHGLLKHAYQGCDICSIADTEMTKIIQI